MANPVIVLTGLVGSPELLKFGKARPLDVVFDGRVSQQPDDIDQGLAICAQRCGDRRCPSLSFRPAILVRVAGVSHRRALAL